MSGSSHRRLNLLTGDWVLVSSHRLERPWNGARAAPDAASALTHDPTCHLCAGAVRASGKINPVYEGVYIFDNDFPALLETAEAPRSDTLLRAEAETGICRVICYAPEHSLTMSQLGSDRIVPVVEAWAQQFGALSSRSDIGAVTIFENRGAMMGASNAHPHGQIWATRSVPNELAKEDAAQRAYFAAHGDPLLSAYLKRELIDGERVICANSAFAAVVPFWAVWPFEALVLPRRAVADLEALLVDERRALADLLADLTARFDRLFDAPFPYSMGWHQRPAHAGSWEHFVAHAHFYPPLLRSASVRKFMVGFEMLAMPQRDLTPEEAAARLRAAVNG